MNDFMSAARQPIVPAMGRVDDEDNTPQILTLEEANALIPELIELVGSQLALGDEIQGLIGNLWELTGPSSENRATASSGAAVIDITIYETDPAPVRDVKTTLSVYVQRYQDGWTSVQQTGAVIKDTSAGLLDFYGRVDGRVVWLCWKYPETCVDWYHEIDAGFGGRKPLADVRKRMLN